MVKQMRDLATPLTVDFVLEHQMSTIMILIIHPNFKLRYYRETGPSPSSYPARDASRAGRVSEEVSLKICEVHDEGDFLKV
jgi:hypothetical protein